MVAVTYTSDLTDITLFESTTGITNYGGGGAAASAGIDYAIEGTNCIDKQVNATERGFLFGAASAFTIGADDHFYEWVCVGTYGLADTRNNRGICVAIGDDTSNFVKFHVNGSDTLPLGGMVPYAIRFVNTTLTNFRTLVGSPGTSPDSIGCTANITGSAKFANLAADACRIGTGYDILNGTGADPEGNFAGIASDDESTREGVLVAVGGGYNLQGKLRIGSASTACEFLDLNTNINIVDTIHSLTDFTEILVEHASSILTLTNINFNALGTNNPGRIEAITSAATLTLNNVGFINFGASIFGSGSTLTNCRWIAAGQITAGNGTFTGCAFDSSPAATAVSAASPAEAAKISNSTFTSDGNGNGLEIGGTAADFTLTNIDFSGYSLTVDADKAIYVNIATGTVNITLTGGSGVSASSHVRTAGATVNVIVGAVTVQITTTDSAGVPIATAKAHLRASDATGPFPYQETVTISRSTTTATVTHTAHGMASNDKVLLRGISDKTEDNTVKQITVTTANAYTYTTTDSGSTSYTGRFF